MRKLERLGLAEPVGSAQWQLSDAAEPTLRAMGERNDIIKRIHRGLTEQGIERSPSEYSIDSVGGQPPLGRLLARGLDDEFTETAYIVIDGIDGRAHHVPLLDVEATSDAAPGAIVEVRRFVNAKGCQREAIAVRSDFPIEAQIKAQGATWLDRQLVAGKPLSLGTGGFGREVREAMHARAEHLIGEGLAKPLGQRIIFGRHLLETLRNRELDAVARGIQKDTGSRWNRLAGQEVTGVYCRRLDLVSGRFAMLSDELGFSLVPWRPSMERHIGRKLPQSMWIKGKYEEIERRRDLGIG
jgi:hypothetical protein